MDLTASPLPPAPVSRSGPSPASLVVRLTALATVTGQPVTVRVLPGDIPAIEVTPEKLLDTAFFLRDELGFDLLSCVSGVDMLAYFEVVYHLRSTQSGELVQLKVKVPTATNDVDSLIPVYITANWLERETYDLFGVGFAGHPDLRRILLDDEFVGHPLRKDFRPTPMAVHDRATTGVDGQVAVGTEAQRNIGSVRAVPSHLSQGESERLHPGTPTFGHTQFHGRDFPPQTWRHRPEHGAKPPSETTEKS